MRKSRKMLSSTLTKMTLFSPSYSLDGSRLRCCKPWRRMSSWMRSTLKWVYSERKVPVLPLAWIWLFLFTVSYSRLNWGKITWQWPGSDYWLIKRLESEFEWVYLTSIYYFNKGKSSVRWFAQILNKHSLLCWLHFPYGSNLLVTVGVWHL